LWQAEIIKGGSFKDVQAMPLDIPFPENQVFIFWPLIVWVLQMRNVKVMNMWLSQHLDD